MNDNNNTIDEEPFDDSTLTNEECEFLIKFIDQMSKRGNLHGEELFYVGMIYNKLQSIRDSSQ